MIVCVVKKKKEKKESKSQIKQTFLYEAQVNGFPQTSNYSEMRNQRYRNWSNLSTRAEILEIKKFTNGQHSIFVFQPI